MDTFGILIFFPQMEDEGNHGNDEIRSFVLSNLTAHHQSRMLCVLCSAPMKVYDRYPLIDGTFFLSPVKHARGSIEVSEYIYVGIDRSYI